MSAHSNSIERAKGQPRAEPEVTLALSRISDPRHGLEHTSSVLALRRALYFLRSELHSPPGRRADKLERAGKPAAKHSAGPARGTAVRQYENGIGDRHSGSPGCRFDRLDPELSPAALGQPPHVVLEYLDPIQAVGAGFLLAPDRGGSMAGLEQQLGVFRGSKRGFDRQVVIDEEMPRRQDHRHAVDAPYACSVVDRDWHLRHAHLHAPQTCLSRRTQFSPMILRMRASFQPRLSIAAERLG